MEVNIKFQVFDRCDLKIQPTYVNIIDKLRKFTKF